MVRKQTAEAFVFIKEEALPFRFLPAEGEPVSLRSHANRLYPDRIVKYVEGADFVVDYSLGQIRRTAGSRIPDGSLHPMYGESRFDHKLYPDYSNLRFTVFADYWTQEGTEEARLTDSEIESSGFLDKFVSKLLAGEEAVYVVYGDSISAGGEASEDALAYYGRFAYTILSLYPDGKLQVVNKSVGGETSEGGAHRVEREVLPLKPDLVSIAYGMNDQNLLEHGNCVPVPDFESNLRSMIEALRSGANCDIVLVTPCEPNPRWIHTSGDTQRYAESIRRLGEEYGIGVADAHSQWRQELAAGKTPESLLLNNINHPNDYGHWIYSQAFINMLRPYHK